MLFQVLFKMAGVVETALHECARRMSSGNYMFQQYLSKHVLSEIQSTLRISNPLGTGKKVAYMQS